MWQAQVAEAATFEPDFKVKGDEIQKLSVIETLPQLLAEDAHSCITRVLPKIQQSLPTASTEFHMAASVIFKQVLEQRLVSHATFTEVFLHSILSSLESREPGNVYLECIAMTAIISHAWLETILDVIELLPVDIIKREILPIAISEGQLTQSVNSRLTCCRLMGKISTRFDSALVKKELLPMVQTLCQDFNNDVRACICLQLRFVAQGIGDDIMKLLPLLVELTSDNESNVRQAAVQTIGSLLPHLKPDTIKDVIVPLIKLSCENALKAEDSVVCVIAQEYGKIAQSSDKHLTPVDKTWFVKYFIQLSQLGSPTRVEESKQDFPFVTGSSVQISDISVECRRSCAYNIPAMFFFASTTPEGTNSLIPTFRNLANDSYYLVRRTIACSFHEVIKVLGSKSNLLKPELIRLLKDDNEEVLQGLIPHVSEILECLLQHSIIGIDQPETANLDLGRALIKCEGEISLTKNWRLSALALNQLEIIPKCFHSDFIFTYLVPVITKRVMYSRPLPVRLAASRTLLVFLRYNLKPQQRTEIRSQICTQFAHSTNCYVRMVFIRMMIDAMSIFSSMYFKEHFCSTLLSLTDDPVPNVRLKVITLLPQIKSCLRLPADKKLLSTMEMNLRNLMSTEKDRDVLAALRSTARQMESIEVRVDSQPSPTKLGRYDSEDMKKYEEEKKIEAMLTGKSAQNVGNLVKKPNVLKMSAGRPSVVPETSNRSVPHKAGTPSRMESPRPATPQRYPLVKQASASAHRHGDHPKASTSSDSTTSSWTRFASNNLQLTQPWERPTTSCHNTNLTSTNPSYNSSNDFTPQKVQCSCYELADRIFRTQAFTSSLSDHSTYHSDSSHCSCLNGSNYLKTTSLFHAKNDYRLTDFGKPFLSSVREDKHDIWQDLMLTRSSFASKYRMPDIPGFQSQYNPYWSFSSMPEIPVTLVDDEFMVDAGIRIPSQLSTSQSSSKIPNLQDIIYRNKKLSSDRSRRSTIGISYEKSKPFGFGLTKSYSVDYDDGKRTPSTSASLSSSGRESPYTSQSSMDDRSKPSGISPQNHTRFGFELSQRKSLEEKPKPRNSVFIEKERTQVKPLHPRNVIDRGKRHTGGYGIKLPETTKDSKLKFKRHSMEVADYQPAERNVAGRALRRFSTLDVNHNQGLSKIPVRSIHISGSRTAPVTRTSSPIRVDSELFEKLGYGHAEHSFSQGRRLRRFRSSDEEVDKLCQKF